MSIRVCIRKVYILPYHVKVIQFLIPPFRAFLGQVCKGYEERYQQMEEMLSGLHMLHGYVLKWDTQGLMLQVVKRYIKPDEVAHKKIGLGIDCFHGYMTKKGLLTYLWCEPTAVTQGSFN